MMRMPGLRLRPARLVTLLACLAIAAPISLVSSGAAYAAGTITQVNPTEGSTLAGTAFTDQMKVSGASGTVTFVQTAGSGSVTVSSSGQVSAASTLAAGTYTMSGTDSDTSGDTGTWTYTLNVLPPAPAGFANTMVSVYQSVYGVVQQMGQASSVQPVSAVQQKVSQLSPYQLALNYYAAQQNPEWYQIPALMQTVASATPTSTATTSTATTSTGSTSTATSSDPPVAPYTHISCPPNVPDAAIFALQIAIDVATMYESIFSIAAGVTVAGESNIGAVDIALVAAITVGALSIAHDGLAYQQQLYNDCSAVDQTAELNNIDNTTYQTYALLTTVGSAVTQIQATGNTTQQDVQNVQSSLSTLQTNFTQTIASDTQALQSTVGSDTQGLTSQLQTDLTGVQNDLTTIEGDESTLSQDVGQLSNGTATIESALSSDLSKILSETDADAAALTTLVTQDNQQILNALKSNFTTQQGQYEANLKLRIENGLAEWGSIVPQVQFMLPASQGGYLNSTPVGVQEVVTDDLNALQALGAKITPAALNAFNNANAALAAGQYITAYQDYATAYQNFA